MPRSNRILETRLGHIDGPEDIIECPVSISMEGAPMNIEQAIALVASQRAYPLPQSFSRMLSASISASVGFWFLASSAQADMIWPD